MLSYAGIQMFMEKLKQLINCNDIPSMNHPSVIHQRPQFQLLYQELDDPWIQTLFMDEHQHLEKVNDLKRRFTDALEEAQYLLDLFVSGVHTWNNGDATRLFKCVVNLFVSCFNIRNDGHFLTSGVFKQSLNFNDVRRSFNLVKVELASMNIGSMKTGSSRRLHDTTLDQSAVAAPVSFTRNLQASKKLMNENVVGLDDDVGLIRDKLVEDQKKLDVVSIVGMGGIGKTTLATKVFHDSYVKHHFYVRVWVTVSQTYDKRDVLIQILESIRCQLHLEKDNSDSRLREMVHKNLKGKRYLIVIDDIWHIETWDDLKVFFPHDNNGSRILLTSRLNEVAQHANSHGLIHHIGYLSKERSWELLCHKVFHSNECPEWSIKPGMEIVKNCKGLPLAVALIGGVLAKEALSEKFWVEFAYKTGSYIVGEQNGCLETLALSYNHLPLRLRECFLYLGGFPEDYRFQVRRLIWLWVAEGFIEQDGNRRLEDIAEGYLMDLIHRNLVIVGHNNFNGALKVVKVHDLVRELCLKIAYEEGFFKQIPNDITTTPYKSARMFINKDTDILHFPYPSIENLRTIMCISRLNDDIARRIHSFVLLRVLDLQQCRLNGFPKGTELLVHLRYLAIWNSLEDFPSSICNLWNLQTLIYIIYHGSGVILPTNISDLVNLRHLWTNNRSVFFLPSIEKPMKLQSVSYVKLGDGVHLQNCFPCIKEVKFMTYSKKDYDFKSLTYLEKLKISSIGKNHFIFPATLKTLTLNRCGLRWSDMSIIQSLPNLQLLKLQYYAFEGSCWNTYGQEFPQLKFLILRLLDIERWEAYSTSFPSLRQLEIFQCRDLAVIPREIGDIPTLELIQIKECRHSVGESVKRIQEEQRDFGNYDLNIDISDDLSDEE